VHRWQHEVREYPEAGGALNCCEVFDWGDEFVMLGRQAMAWQTLPVEVAPVLPGTSYVDWGLDDPAGQSLERVRELRDEIEQRVAALAGELDSARTASA